MCEGAMPGTEGWDKVGKLGNNDNDIFSDL